MAIKLSVRAVGTWCRRAVHRARMANCVLELSVVPQMGSLILSLGSTSGSAAGGWSTGKACRLRGMTTTLGLLELEFSVSSSGVSILMHQAQLRDAGERDK